MVGRAILCVAGLAVGSFGCGVVESCILPVAWVVTVRAIASEVVSRTFVFMAGLASRDISSLVVEAGILPIAASSMAGRALPRIVVCRKFVGMA